MALLQWDAIRAEAMICQFTPELIHQDIFDFLWESDVGDSNGHAAFLAVNFIF